MNTPVSDVIAYKGGHVHSTNPEASVRQAVHLMNEKKVGALLVIHDDKPVGMFTERDVLVRIVDAGKNPETTNVHEVMSSKLVTIKPTLPIEKAMKIMTEKRCRHIPVMEEGKLLGMVSIGDLTRWIVREHESYIDNLLNYISGGYPT